MEGDSHLRDSREGISVLDLNSKSFSWVTNPWGL